MRQPVAEKLFLFFLGSIIQFINQNPQTYQTKKNNGLQLLWITPLRALAKDIGRAMEDVIAELNMQWKVGIRNGDTEIAERQKQTRSMPEVLNYHARKFDVVVSTKKLSKFF